MEWGGEGLMRHVAWVSVHGLERSMHVKGSRVTRVGDGLERLLVYLCVVHAKHLRGVGVRRCEQGNGPLDRTLVLVRW